MTQPVDFTTDAVKDLSGIASYTAEAWGYEQALRYAELLNEKFKKIARKNIVKTKNFAKPVTINTNSLFSVFNTRTCTRNDSD